jgi:hypothetical protein
MKTIDILVVAAFGLLAVAIIVWNGVKHYRSRKAKDVSGADYIRNHNNG